MPALTRPVLRPGPAVQQGLKAGNALSTRVVCARSHRGASVLGRSNTVNGSDRIMASEKMLSQDQPIVLHW